MTESRQIRILESLLDFWPPRIWSRRRRFREPTKQSECDGDQHEEDCERFYSHVVGRLNTIIGDTKLVMAARRAECNFAPRGDSELPFKPRIEI